MSNRQDRVVRRRQSPVRRRSGDAEGGVGGGDFEGGVGGEGQVSPRAEVGGVHRRWAGSSRLSDLSRWAPEIAGSACLRDGDRTGESRLRVSREGRVGPFAPLGGIVAANVLVVGPSFQLNKHRSRQVSERDFHVLRNIIKMIDSNDAAVAGKVNHVSAEVVGPNEMTEAADESRYSSVFPALVRQAYQSYLGFELLVRYPFWQEDDEVSFAVAGDMEIRWVSPKTIGEAEGDSVLGEMAQVSWGSHVDYDSVVSAVLASEKNLRRGGQMR
uniref:Uncharacterized protein n=1 Tax=Ananas comosus var. bracteatus TaxID=296719 RepID=A0A6V7QJY0_ANACO|nr:unnamed protein product [Ananas comosus var. bracteatus]